MSTLLISEEYPTKCSKKPTFTKKFRNDKTTVCFAQILQTDKSNYVKLQQ